MNCKKWISLILVTLMMLFCLTACGGDNENAKLVGTWKLDSTLINSEAQETSDTDVIFTFQKNGKGSRSTGEKEDFTFEYKYDGETCVMKNVINANGTIGTSGSFQISVDGDKMTILTEGEDDTVEIIFAKQ